MTTVTFLKSFSAFYIVASMAITTMSLFMTVYIVNIFYHNPHKKVPGWLKNYVLVFVARITCFTPRSQESTIFHVE